LPTKQKYIGQYKIKQQILMQTCPIYTRREKCITVSFRLGTGNADIAAVGVSACASLGGLVAGSADLRQAVGVVAAI
jgi:hypothetical protein